MADQKGALHEEVRHNDELVVGSDRSFGFVFTVFFGLVGLARPHFMSRGLELVGLGQVDLRMAAWAVAGVFLLLALVIPKVLHPLNVLWMRFGLVLQKIISPIVLGVLFFLGVTPLGVIMRLRGKDLLRLKLDKSAASYWITRDPPGPPPDTMRNQF